MKTKYVFFILLILSFGCGETSQDNNEQNNVTNNGTNSGTNNGVDNASCQSRCVSKATECGTPASQAGTFCSEKICPLNPTESNISCFEGESCAVLGGVFADPEGEFCGLELGKKVNNVTNGDSCDMNDGSELCKPDPDFRENTYNHCLSSRFCEFPETGCLYEIRTGLGTCVATCSEADIGTQGSCPDGTECRASSQKDGSGFNWSVCN